VYFGVLRFPGPNLGVERVYAAGLDSDQNLVFTCRRAVYIGKNKRAAVMFENNGPHRRRTGHLLSPSEIPKSELILRSYGAAVIGRPYLKAPPGTLVRDTHGFNYRVSCTQFSGFRHCHWAA
jgi:hypothetical protein